MDITQHKASIRRPWRAAESRQYKIYVIDTLINDTFTLPEGEEIVTVQFTGTLMRMVTRCGT
jgi:hypothetical protein